MCATIGNPLIRNPQVCYPANHYRLACIKPGFRFCRRQRRSRVRKSRIRARSWGVGARDTIRR
eukprot:12769136-Alexandrium_andersonii.AAC.1